MGTPWKEAAVAMILDASALIARLDAADAFHRSARTTIPSEGLTIHSVNLAEAASVFFRSGVPAADSLLVDLIASPDLEIAYDPVEIEAARLHARRPSKKVSLADCFAAALAAARSLPVIAADQDFRWFESAAGIQVKILDRT